MLLINFLCIFAKLTLVSGYCDVGNLKLTDFDWTNVGVSILSCFL